jgi:hypothetical protein
LGSFAEQNLKVEVIAPADPSEPPKHERLDTLPRFTLRVIAMDEGHYAAFEAFLNEAGMIPSQNPVSKIAMDVTAQ